ncbi:MAG: pitrilysin family protein [Pseudomonadota bacterium]
MYRKTILDNGIRVISEEIDHARSISIGIWVLCGSRHEDRHTNGMAHFIEHMLFKGTRIRTAFDIASAIDSVGGVMNAFTGKDLTSLYIKIPDYHLAMAIDLLADIFNNSRFDPEEINKEKSVVLQEINLLDDSPDDCIHDYFDENFWRGHPLGYRVLGSKALVESFDRDAIVGFVNDHYLGESVVLTAAGHLKHDVLTELVSRAFGFVHGPGRHNGSGPPDASAEISVLHKDLEQVHMIVGCPAPSSISPLRYACFLLNAVLGGSMSSRLFQEIREKRGLAYAIHSYMTSYQDTGLLGIYVGTSGDRVQDIVGLIFDELRRMTDVSLTERELRSARELVKGNFLLSMESTDNRMTRLATNEIAFREHIPAEEVVRQIDCVTAEEIRTLAGEMFNPSAIGLAAIGPIAEKDLTLGILKC